MKIKNIISLLFIAVLALMLFRSCKVTYSFSGASIDPKIKTLSVRYFPNHAEIVIPTLAQQFTDALREKFRSQTRLKLVNTGGDVVFEGEISRYNTQAMAIQGNDRPAMNRLTMDVKVRYTNNIKPEESYEQTFTRYAEYGSAENLATVEGKLIELLVDQLTEDVFNRAFVNW